MAKEVSEVQLMRELEPTLGELLNRHEKASKFWVPDEYIPWSRGRDYNYPWAKSEQDKKKYNSDGLGWEEAQATYQFSEEVKSSLIIAALTEDNLPSYHREIANLFGYDGAWRNWVNRWTAEEDRHGRAIHNLLAVSRTVDPVKLEEARMTQVGRGFVSDLPTDDGSAQSLSAMEGAVYVSFQEPATVIAHKNTGEHCQTEGDRIAGELFARISKDEILHGVVYRELVKAGLDIAPNLCMKAIARVVKGFQMPGAATIPEFGKHAINIAVAGIYDLHAQNRVFKGNMKEKHWNIWNRSDLNEEGERARDDLAATLKRLDKQAVMFDEHVVQPLRAQKMEREE